MPSREAILKVACSTLGWYAKLSTLFVILILSCRIVASGQDSLQFRADTLLIAPLGKFDSTLSKVKGATDFVHSLTNPADTLTPDLTKYNQQLDEIKGKLTHRIDSLKQLNLSTDKYSHLLDSINTAGPLKNVAQAQAGLTSLQGKVTAPVTNINSKISGIGGKVNEKLTLINTEGGPGTNLPGSANVPGVNNPGGVNGSLPGAQINMPGGALPGVNNPLQGALPDTSLPENPLNTISNAPGEQLNKLTEDANIGKVTEQIDKVGGYTEDVKNLSKGNLDQVKALPQEAESKALEATKVDGLGDKTAEISKYKDLAGDPDAMQSEALEQVKREAFDHFAGKEVQLQAAMQQLIDLKTKYKELASIQDLPKHIPNEMHGKPLVERLIPAITLQLHIRDYALLDLNPNIGYRLTGHFTVGGGWNERVGITHWHFTSRDRIYGPRTFLDYYFAQNWAARTEVEVMNMMVPEVGMNNPEQGTRQWVWGWFLGIKKEYRFSEHVRGNIQTMFNLLTKNNSESPYGNRFVVRMGFEFPMKKKPRDEKK